MLQVWPGVLSPGSLRTGGGFTRIIHPLMLLHRLGHSHQHIVCCRISRARLCCRPAICRTASGMAEAGPDCWCLPDAHTHPQDDLENIEAIAKLSCCALAVMGVKEDAWQAVERALQVAPVSASLAMCCLLSEAGIMHPAPLCTHARVYLHYWCAYVFGRAVGTHAHAPSWLQHKVIPCFGIHPWFAHLHASELCFQPDNSSRGDGSTAAHATCYMTVRLY